MPKRSISLIVILAAMLAACAAPGASLEPSVSGDPTNEPSPSIAASLNPSPSLAPPATQLPQPAEGCTSLDDVDLSDVEVDLGSVDEDGNGGVENISVGRVGARMDEIRITELSGQRRSVVPTPRQVPETRGQILGGHEFVAFPSIWFDGHVNPQAMISANVTLKLDGQPALDLASRFIPGNENFDQVAIAVPDVSGKGVLSMAMVWADPCFRYEASLTNVVDVVPLSETAGCALELRSYYDQVAALLNGSLSVGSVPAHAFSPRNQAKYTTMGNPGIDAFLLYAFDRDDPAIVAAPGEVVRIGQLSSDITVGNQMDMTVLTRASVARAIKDYPPVGTVTVISKTGARQADGTFRLRVPTDPGRYVAGFMTTYDSHCSSGELWFVVNIDVVAPTATPPSSVPPSPA